MHLAKKLGIASFLLSATLFLTACPQQETISRINADPGRYRNKEVAIVGRVTNSYGVMGNGAYEIDDGTGRIWVVTTRGVPSRGSRVGAKGRVYNGLSFGGRSYGTVLEETDRRAKSR
ncbi:MAG TPA: OB-fold nucleic acid binding domain-containing protein [Pyrinomonadaceae bacterium]|nr:OB-fold nucleic acid binding domain-containing protein [Pyrinomonadaceae bacterium]